jgi:hypothetical protein
MQANLVVLGNELAEQELVLQSIKNRKEIKFKEMKNENHIRKHKLPAPQCGADPGQSPEWRERQRQWRAY